MFEESQNTLTCLNKAAEENLKPYAVLNADILVNTDIIVLLNIYLF